MLRKFHKNIVPSGKYSYLLFLFSPSNAIASAAPHEHEDNNGKVAYNKQVNKNFLSFIHVKIGQFEIGEILTISVKLQNSHNFAMRKDPTFVLYATLM